MGSEKSVEGTVVYAERDQVAWITLNRPDKLNALNRTVFADLGRALDRLEATDDAVVGVLHGAGRAFAAGADIQDYVDISVHDYRAFMDVGRAVSDRLASLAKPVIAAVQGFALGGGFELVLACDLVIAADNARFGLPETKLGLVPGGGGTQRLPRLVGRMRATELMITGRFLTADEAQAWGIVNQVVAKADLLERAGELAASVVAQAPEAVSTIKRIVREGADAALPTALSLEQDATARLIVERRRARGDRGVRREAPAPFRRRTMSVSPSLLSERGRAIYGPTPPGQAIPCRRTTPLDADERKTVVELIAGGREGRHSVVLPEELQTRDWESVTQIALDLDERLGWDPIGWKIGAASDEIRRAEGLPSASPGRIYRSTVFTSPASLPPELFINYRNVECEFAFRLRTALPPRDEAYTEDEVAAAIECLMPTLEIGDTVFEDWYGSSAFFGSCLDNGGGAALVCGEPIEEWRELDLPNARIGISLNGQYINEGWGRAAMGHPLTSLTWLVNWLLGHGRGMDAGEIVSTGTCTGHCFCAPGDSVSVDFGRIGT